MLIYPTLLIPCCAWLLMGCFKSVPRELAEAARVASIYYSFVVEHYVAGLTAGSVKS